jgi:hypothetical protein
MKSESSGLREQRFSLNWLNSLVKFHMESLILAQNERWRRGLGMQVEREGPAMVRKVANG